MSDVLSVFKVYTPARRWLEMHLNHQDREFCLIWPFSRAQNGYGTAGHAGYIRPHRIMCEHRNGPPPSDKHQAAHSCGNGHLGCVNPWHVNWRTPAENQRERYQQHGLMPSRKLTPEQVDEIRSMKSRERTVDTAERFQVTEANIRQIQSGKIWRLDKKQRRAFTAEEVEIIRSLPKRGNSARQIGERYGVNRSVIERIRKGKSYRYFAHPSHVRGEP